MSVINVEIIQSILFENQNMLAENDKKYREKLHRDRLYNDNKTQMENGCKILVDRLKDIPKKDISYDYKSDIKYKLFSQEELEQNKDKLYFYTQCTAMTDFVKTFNKNGSNIMSIVVENPFVNRIEISKDKLKENKIEYKLSYEEEYKDKLFSQWATSYTEKVPQYPSPDNVFFCFQ